MAENKPEEEAKEETKEEISPANIGLIEIEDPDPYDEIGETGPDKCPGKCWVFVILGITVIILTAVLTMILAKSNETTIK